MSALVLLAAVSALVVGAAAVAHRPTVPMPLSPALQRTATTVARWRLAGLVLGVAAAIGTAQLGALGRGLLLAAPVGALVLLAGVVAGELRVARPTGRMRSAVIEVRRPQDYLPDGLAACVGAAIGLLGIVLTVTTAMGSADDLGRAGRSLFRRCSSVMAESHGPWPGWYYTGPLAVVVVCGLAVCAGALARVVRRPRVGEDRSADDVLRHRSAEAVTAAAGLLVAVPLAGSAAVAAMGLFAISCRPGWFVALGAGLGVAAAAALGLAAWCAAVLVVGTSVGARPSTRRPSTREPVDR